MGVGKLPGFGTTADPTCDVDDLTSIFLAHLPSPSSALSPGGDAPVGAAPPPDDLADLLQRLESAARAAWPALALQPERFAAYLAARIPADHNDLRLALADVHAEDLYLACACVDGLSGAIAAFRERHRGVVADVVRGVDASPAFADEVEQLLFQRLFVAGDSDEAHPPRITNYSGRGPLAGWVGVAAQRTALSLRRGEVAQKRARQRAIADRLSVDLDPELLYLKQRYRAEFEIAFERAVAGLSDRERTILRLHLVAGLTLDAIGVMYHVNASTVSRWLASTRQRLSFETEKDLRLRLNLSPAEFDSLARLVVSQLDFSICRWLQDPAADPSSDSKT
jgi:RNA polymerase sigma-70 factor (ECF subfamily)